MRHASSLAFVFAALATVGVARAETPIPDAPARWVTDHVGFMSPAARNDIDSRLAEYAHATGHQVLVYVGLTTGGTPIEDWAVKAFERWRVGRKGIDDGLVLFIFSADRQLRIEIGYGLEPVMTDARASRIIREVIVPRIRDGDRDGAVRAGVDALLETLGAATTTPAPARSPARSRFSPEDKRTLSIVALGFLAIPVLLLLLFGLVCIWPGRAWLRDAPSASGPQRRDAERDRSPDLESSSTSQDSDGFSGGGGRSGGGGASGSW